MGLLYLLPLPNIYIFIYHCGVTKNIGNSRPNDSVLVWLVAGR